MSDESFKEPLLGTEFEDDGYVCDWGENVTDNEGKHIVNRRRRRKRVEQVVPPKKTERHTIIGVSVSEKIDIQLFFKESERIFTESPHKFIQSDVLCFSLNSNKLVFFFDFGVIVFWGFTLSEVYSKLKVFETFYKKRDITEDETISYSYGDRFKISNDHVYLETNQVMEKLAVSYALAQSVQLALHENSIDDTISVTMPIQEELAIKGSISLTQKEITKKIGQLFLQRAYINLQSELLDTPDCFWDYDEWENVYNLMRNYLDLDMRIGIVNQRLELLKELLDMLNDELTKKHEHNLEWIIIYLIVIEVFIAVVWDITIKDVLKLV